MRRLSNSRAPLPLRIILALTLVLSLSATPAAAQKDALAGRVVGGGHFLHNTLELTLSRDWISMWLYRPSHVESAVVWNQAYYHVMGGDFHGSTPYGYEDFSSGPFDVPLEGDFELIRNYGPAGSPTSAYMWFDDLRFKYAGGPPATLQGAFELVEYYRGVRVSTGERGWFNGTIPSLGGGAFLGMAFEVLPALTDDGSGCDESGTLLWRESGQAGPTSVLGQSIDGDYELEVREDTDEVTLCLHASQAGSPVVDRVVHVPKNAGGPPDPNDHVEVNPNASSDPGPCTEQVYKRDGNPEAYIRLSPGQSQGQWVCVGLADRHVKVRVGAQD